jgi:hypothetical protein
MNADDIPNACEGLVIVMSELTSPSLYIIKVINKKPHTKMGLVNNLIEIIYKFKVLSNVIRKFAVFFFTFLK